MASIKRSISSKVDGNGKSEIMFRLSITKDIKHRLKSGIFVAANRFKDGNIIKPRANQKVAAELLELEKKLIAVEQLIYDLCQSQPTDELTKDFIQGQIENFHHPKKEKKPAQQAEKKKLDLYDYFAIFLKGRDISESRRERYAVLERLLRRFEAYRRIKRKLPSKIEPDTLSVDMLNDLLDFMGREPEIYDKYPKIYDRFPLETRKARKTARPQLRGHNATVHLLGCLRTFWHWLLAEEITNNDPFKKFKGKTVEHYGTPYYITIEERDQIADFDLSAFPALAVQRDIFIFQCYIGCRVGDLERFTMANIVGDGDFLEYIASKTRESSSKTIRVPLAPRAKEIILRYEGNPKLHGKLLPFISQQKYNAAIKDVFTKCGITRIITTLDPKTGNEVQRPLNEVASSHMARRTFVGNLYKQVKDPNLVGSLSGHKEGSRAFARYREIDDDMKRDLINLIK